MCSFHEKTTLFYSPCGNVPKFQSALGKIFMLCQMVLLPSIYFYQVNQTGR